MQIIGATDSAIADPGQGNGGEAGSGPHPQPSHGGDAGYGFAEAEGNQPVDILVDASALSLLHCQRRYQLTCLQGIDTSSRETSWGSAFHQYVEAVYRGSLDTTALLVMQAAQKFKLDPNETARLLTTCMTFDAQIKRVQEIRDHQNEPFVEWKFSFPYATVGRFRIVLCGTIDLVYTPADNWLVFRDWKTTARTSGLDDQLNEYVASFQLPFYMYCLQYHLAHFAAPQWVEHLAAGRLHGEYFMVYKSFTPARFKQSSPVMPWAREDVEAVIHKFIPEIISIAEMTTLAPATGAATTKCRKCNYLAACLARNPEQRNNILRVMPRRVYNPMQFR